MNTYVPPAALLPLTALLLAPSRAPGQEPDAAPPPLTAATITATTTTRPGELQLRTERVVIFKDGHALLTKIARGVVGKDGKVFTDSVPDSAVLGSFWASCERTPIRSMTAQWVEEATLRSTAAPCATMRELLRANVGRDVRVTLQWPEERQVAARIIAVLEEEPVIGQAADATPHASPYPHLYAPASHSSTAAQGRVAATETLVATRAGGTFVVIEPSAGGEDAQRRRSVLPIADVRAISGEDLVTSCAREEKVTKTRKRLAFDVGSEAAGQEVEFHIAYFTPGLRWIPTYRLTGDLDESGRMALQAEILNELEDIDGAAVDLVVGVPNFRFGDVISPLSLERTMRNVLAQAAPQIMGNSNAMSNAFFAQRSSEWRPEEAHGAGPTDGLDMAKELAFTGEQDLFVYSVGRLSVPRGSRMAVPLWSNEVALAHLYTMDVDVVRDTTRGHVQHRSGNGRSESPLRLAKNDVWHQFLLENGSATPWTTGAALVTKGALPLAQELLTYTPAGSSTLLPITVAVDVRGDYDEREVSREPAAFRWNNVQYNRVVHRGTVKITNHKKSAVDVRIDLGLGGEVLSTEGGPKVTARDFQASDWQGSNDLRMNGHADVVWRFRLEPGAAREVSVEFVTFVR